MIVLIDKYVLPSMNTMKCHQLTGRFADLYHKNRVGVCMHDTIETAFYTVYAAHMHQKLVEQAEKIISMK